MHATISVFRYLENKIRQQAEADLGAVSCILLPSSQALLDFQKHSEKPGSCAQSKLAYWYFNSGLIYLTNVTVNQRGGLLCDMAYNFVEYESYC